MEAKVLFVCLFVSLCICCVYGQVGSLCRPNERLLQCGCPKTCRDPVPSCKGVCKEGCFCEKGEVRNDEGRCVKLADCPPIPSQYRQDTSEPRDNGGICPENEEYRFCEPCNRTCDSPNPICPAQCAKGCFCKGKLLRDVDGKCVHWGQCSKILAYIKEKESTFIEPVSARFSCSPDKVYKECVKCIKHCNDPKPVCSTKCIGGCFCRDGTVMGPDRMCVKEEECPNILKHDVLD